jgi:hypothetical protein
VPTPKEIKEQVSAEAYRRGRLAVPAFAGGFLYLLGGIIASTTLKGAPTVGLLQGLVPAFNGEVNPSVSPRTGEVKFISHHAFPLIAGSVLSAIAVIVLTLVLLLLVDATRFRRPSSWAAVRPLVLVGGIGLAVLTIGHQAISSIQTHSFAVGHDFSSSAVDNALTKGAANEITEYVDLIAGLSLMAGVIATSLGALRVGLLPRWMAILGCFTGVLIFLPIGGATLEVVPSFWLVMMGILCVGKWPNGEPPAWQAGEARPWPSAAERRAEAGEQRAAKQAAKGQPALSAAGADIAPAPAQPASNGRAQKRRRRKRSARG